jgi:DtxR family Mn-dependent transcriptional regulator
MTDSRTAANPAFAQYCEAIFELQEDDVDVIQARIAERLGISRPAVSEMVRRLEAEELIRLERMDGGDSSSGQVRGRIQLTTTGRALAESVVRRHRLAERMLTDVLGLSWSEAHVEASRWEQVISPAVERAINRLLNDPTTCPHGNPIPGSDYRPPDVVQLSELGPHQRFLVTRIPEELEFTPGLLEFLESASVTPGNRGGVSAVSPDGTMTIEVNGTYVGISRFAADRILVVRGDTE